MPPPFRSRRDGDRQFQAQPVPQPRLLHQARRRPSTKKVVVVKSMQHFHAAYAPIARKWSMSPRPARWCRTGRSCLIRKPTRHSGRSWPTRTRRSCRKLRRRSFHDHQIRQLLRWLGRPGKSGYNGTPVNDRRYSKEELGDVLHKAVAYAKKMDGLGYETFWMAEHHFQPRAPSASRTC